MFRKVVKDSFLTDIAFMGRTLFPFNQYSNLYCRLLEKEDAEKHSLHLLMEQKVATEDDADKSISKLKIMSY